MTSQTMLAGMKFSITGTQNSHEVEIWQELFLNLLQEVVSRAKDIEKDITDHIETLQTNRLLLSESTRTALLAVDQRIQHLSSDLQVE